METLGKLRYFFKLVVVGVVIILGYYLVKFSSSLNTESYGYSSNFLLNLSKIEKVRLPKCVQQIENKTSKN